MPMLIDPEGNVRIKVSLWKYCTTMVVIDDPEVYFKLSQVNFKYK